MSDTAAQQTPLGVGALLGDSFQLYFRNFPMATFLAFVPVLILTALTAAILGAQFIAADPFDAPDPGADILGSILLLNGLQIIGYSIATAIMVRFAYDAKLGRSARVGTYLSSALRNLPALIVLSIVIYVCMAIAMIAVIIPGLWVLAVWSVAIPAIVIESAGFGALGRSSALTKEYRWPIVGFLVALGLIMIVVSFIFTFIVGAIASALGGVILLIVVQALFSAATFALANIGIALLFARLKEIKEGVAVDSLVEIFE